MIANSDPDTMNVTASPSASVAVTVPIAVWFSAAVKVADEVKTGGMFSVARMVTYSSIAAAVTLSASLATTPLVRKSPVRPNKYRRIIKPSVRASTFPLLSTSSRLPKLKILASMSSALV